MRIRNLLLGMCMLLLMGMSMKVEASELSKNAISGIAVEQEPEIRILDSDEAERLFKELYHQPGGITTWSNLGVCEIGISESGGDLLVVYSTGSKVIADRIGARNVTLQRKNGLFWENVVVRSGYSENTSTYYGGFYLTNPENGRQYRAECTHYVIVNGYETSGYNETAPHTFIN